MSFVSSFPDIKVLLIQAREEQDMREQEHTCFVERTRLAPSQILTYNLPVDAINNRPEKGFDAVFIGGAGAFSAWEDYDWMPHGLDTVRRICDSGIPVFGSCWGHQMIARALGGSVVHDPLRAEMGCLPVHLTEAGAKDPLLGTFPRSFLANMGHHDRVVALPEGAVELARSESQPNEAFRIQDRPIYGTQFHSELDAARERERLLRYQRFYADELPDARVLQRVIDGLAETTDVDHLLYDFLALYFTS